MGPPHGPGATTPKKRAASDPSMRTLLVLALLALPALTGCLNDTDDGYAFEDADSVPPVPRVNATATLDDLRHFSKTYPERASNTADHVLARDWLARQFQEAGLEVWRHEFEDGIRQENIVGIKWGEVRDQWVVVGAHYDMTTTDCAIPGSPIGGGFTPECATRAYSEGAYDDGSGTMMTVNLAEAFADVPTHYSIAFVPFDGEERGLQGSGAFARAILDHATPYGEVDVVGMLDLDMIGLNWPGVDAPIYFDSNSEALEGAVMAKADELGMPEDSIKYQGISLGRSDYAHFFAMGVPTGFFISDFEEFQTPADIPVTTPSTGGPAGGAYPFWHVEDTWETMELMAGSYEDLESGFQTALDLSAELIHLFAARPYEPLDVQDQA